ncbi:MAG: FAD-dependent oxidoreductase [Sedimentisphaerales bacterium]|nr:FAD-dependent oxidoreductase [Sedimentisphaerales bacterium]
MADIQTDVVIVGAGPAGLGAALYTARDRYQTVILDKFVPGGQINLTDRIENYPGITRISGPDLVSTLKEQVSSFGAQIKTSAEVTHLEQRDNNVIAVTTEEDVYLARVAILAPGSDYRHLGVPGEDKFRRAGTGVSYCGTCDAPFFRDKHVITVGGGNVAVEDTIHLSKYCRKITMIHRRQEFRATKVLVEELLEEAKKGIIDIRYDTVLDSINGTDKVESATLKNVKTEQTEDLPCDGVFIFVGMIPNTGFLKDTIALDANGFIQCDPEFLRTRMPGVFVAGDCRVGAAMQLATAIADGVAAAMFMKEYLRDPSWWNKGICLKAMGWS